MLSAKVVQLKAPDALSCSGRCVHLWLHRSKHCVALCKEHVLGEFVELLQAHAFAVR